MAAAAVFHHAAQTVEFFGTDAQPARLWQGASQLEAASVVLDRTHDTLTARPAAVGGQVHAVFASMGMPAAEGGDRGARRAKMTVSKEPRVVRVASARLDYSGASEEAVFSGGVHTEGATGEVRAQRGVVFLSSGAGKGGAAKDSAGENGAAGKVVDKGRGQSDLLGGAVDRIVLSGDVHLEQPGRHGTGEQLLYTAASGEFVLTGSTGRPPHVADERQGSITGGTLVFTSPDSTIIVMGEPAARGAARGRVHTETPVKQ
jgi:lipopolysaccharide export system protein LptA